MDRQPVLRSLPDHRISKRLWRSIRIVFNSSHVPAYPSAPLVRVEEPFHRLIHKNPKVSKPIDVCAEGIAEHWAKLGKWVCCFSFFHSPHMMRNSHLGEATRLR